MDRSTPRAYMSSEDEAMNRQTRPVSAKSGRKRAIQEEEAEAHATEPKKPRTHGPIDDDVVGNQIQVAGAPTTRARSGLLTPEASNLTESQLEPPVEISETSETAKTNFFPFMKLPAELRIHIYHMALVREEPLLLHADRAPEKPEDGDDPFAVPRRTYVPGREPPGHAFHRPRQSGPERIPLDDPIVPEILRLNKLIYREARQVLYSDNVFTLSLTSGIHTLSTLHQRSRSLIKHVVLTIPSHHDILDGFADLVRLGLRYCWGLKTFKIILQASLPDDGRVTGATSVYANAFHILRWLPRGCNVGLEGNVSDTVKRVVAEEGRLQAVLDEVRIPVLGAT
jgi:epsin